ncbi:NUDIX hydrolase [Coprothermobacteraceae bacterium]|nr:NUDIX hydrolase [Coprothermobacteraceae bacterium]
MRRHRKLFEGNFLTVELVDGKYEIVRRPQAVGALVYWIDRVQLVVVKHRRPTVDEALIEVVAGLVSEDETPESAVKREVQEEVGLDVVRLFHLGTFLLTPGYSDEMIHLYFAEATGPVLTTYDSSEELEPISIRIGDVWDMDIRDAKTLLALLLSKEMNFLKSIQNG